MAHILQRKPSLSIRRSNRRWRPGFARHVKALTLKKRNPPMLRETHSASYEPPSHTRGSLTKDYHKDTGNTISRDPLCQTLQPVVLHLAALESYRACIWGHVGELSHVATFHTLAQASRAVGTGDAPCVRHCAANAIGTPLRVNRHLAGRSF